ncbi:hypothetical protein ACI2LU_27845, partial [Streptomyces angustmyceticus]
MEHRTPGQDPGRLRAGAGGGPAPRDMAVDAAPLGTGAAPPSTPPAGPSSPGSGRSGSVADPPGDLPAAGRGATPPAPAAESGREEAEHAPGTPTDRLRYLEAATRRIAGGIDQGETLRELCRA